MECFICFEKQGKEKLCLLNCSHELCETCLIHWMERKRQEREEEEIKCPYCRQVVKFYTLDKNFIEIEKETVVEKKKEIGIEKNSVLFLVFLNCIAPLAIARLLFFSLPLCLQLCFILSITCFISASLLMSCF